MTSAGDLRHRLGFFRRPVISDGHGNVEGAFPDAPEFECAAAVQVRFGGEAVLAARLQGQQTATIRVRRSQATLAVTTDWRIRDMREGAIWEIKSGPVDPDDGRQWVEFLCQSGVAA
ncbi:head-tail adaptor protein [Bradyrhizobium barranii subsp. barranii]|uniref:Head-tail adaptor protein n=1 Tax=Bradyrhizobium barranii subsp. barranii TaxID=2823807 RepID=A0A939MAZ5_9BRAD|nr:head-tail adaptor protein [Bradyrhizobium barranii]UEM17340.1 head-tail adaptor protein [Bradyrhizobium barranii subsp. barranii]